MVQKLAGAFRHLGQSFEMDQTSCKFWFYYLFTVAAIEVSCSSGLVLIEISFCSVKLVFGLFFFVCLK